MGVDLHGHREQSLNAHSLRGRLPSHIRSALVNVKGFGEGRLLDEIIRSQGESKASSHKC